MKLALSRVEAKRNFANKIWNAARFVIGNLEGEPRQLTGGWDADDSAAGRPLDLSRQHRLTADVTRLIEDYQFGEAGRQIYDFLWGEYCDWYIEIARFGSTARTRRRARRRTRCSSTCWNARCGCCIRSCPS